ncbi:LamG domain-containing protein, partial [Candidatus Woesearchaeota archaeon]|nr:LamG domain-containing protein [Candidatus Woesearchaeota archaeon]
NESVWARDYSGNDNHASHVSAFWNSSGGYDGWGAYECDSSDDYLLIPEHSSLEQADAMTVSLWLYSKDASANYEALNYRMDSDRFNGAYQVRDDQVHVSVFNGSGADDIVVPFPEIPADSWHHVAFTFSRAEQNISVYINGSFYSSNSTGGDFPVYYSGASKQGLVIGKAGTAERPWNGSIDEVLIFDRVLSPGQLEGIYEGDFWTVTSDDIGGGDSWQVCITPNDGVEDGGTVCSNNLTVGELTAPSPFLPANNSIITDSRNPLYVWNNTAHPSAVSLTYDIEVANVSDFSSSVVNATAVAEGSVNSSYWNTSALSFITDYFWRVRARYGAEVSDWTGAMKYNILPVTSCAQPMDEMDFGQMCIYEDQDRCNDEGLGSHINDTLDNHPPPYVFENDGNLRTNGTVYSTPLWESTSKGDMPFRYYQFMLEAREAGTYSWALDSAWVNMSASEGSAPLSLHSFRWENASDEFNLHIRLEVPTDEPPGAKYSTTYAICEQNETY